MLCVSEIRIKTKFIIRSKGKIVSIILCFYNSCIFFFLFLNFSLSENDIVYSLLFFSSPLFPVQEATFYSSEGSEKL